ncbi:MAG: epsJ [Acidimicrobiaceae bacterium]|nr:epsJ [Acidimicrobiaceae bacterium]
MSSPATGELAASRGAISFVVIAYNEQANICACLDSLIAQRGLGLHEIIVVDDGSTDATAAIVADYALEHPTVRLIHQPNSGRGAARAVGVDAASGELLAMVDADICLPEHWLTTCIAALNDHAVVGGTAIPDGDVAYLHRRFSLEALPAPSTTTITGNNGLYRREVFQSVRFDPGLRNGEDVDLNHQLVEAGWRAACLPGLHVDHREHKSFLTSVFWLFESGRGATGQLLRYRQIRPPDLAYAGFVAVLASMLSVRSRHRHAAQLLPMLYVTAVAGRHLGSKFAFRWQRSYLVRFACATAANSILISSYFAGRTVEMLVRSASTDMPAGALRGPASE